MKELSILLIEDNEGDVVLTKEALSESRILNRVTVAEDGEKALELLYKVSAQKSADPMPDLILLDINLPRVDGKTVLKKLKADPVLKSIPVVMLTSSALEKDIREAYGNHANCYIVKPIEFGKFSDIIHKIENFWLGTVRLPEYN